jgi:predicted amidohydrolase
VVRVPLRRPGTTDRISTVSFLAAVCQMTSTSDADANWRQAEELIRAAAKAGAAFVGTPENATFLGPHAAKVRGAEPLDGATCSRFAALAGELGIELLLGSFNERGRDSARCRNTSVLFGRDGSRRAVYRKLHLFDVDVPGGVSFRESETVESGDEVVVAETPLARFGLSICYDLRFGELYRALVARGAEAIFVPSAFTAATGAAHWEALLRARAIESQAYVLAPAQWGRHDDGGLKESFGRAMIVDPWGEVLARIDEGTGFALAEIDLEKVARVRAAIPTAKHRKGFL